LKDIGRTGGGEQDEHAASVIGLDPAPFERPGNHMQMRKCRATRALRIGSASLLGGLILLGTGLGALSGCGGERAWATEESPPMRLGPGESRQATRLGPSEEEAIREAALRIAGGQEAWDGTRRLQVSGARWTDVPDALAAACAREDVQCVISEVSAAGTGDRWAFELMTAEREPGWVQVERDDHAEGVEARVTEIRLGRRPNAEAMQRRADRLVAAFHEEMARIGARLRFVEPGSS